MKKEVKGLLDRLCVESGYCLPPEKVKYIIERDELEADQFAYLVLSAEGLNPDNEITQRRKIRNLFIEKFGCQKINHTNFPHDCPVCGLENAFSELGSYEICPQCKWEDDLVQYNDPDFKGGANTSSLNQARNEWKARS
jgi:hypothetical protein